MICFPNFKFCYVCSFPGKAVGVSIGTQAAPADSTPAKESEKVCTLPTYLSILM